MTSGGDSREIAVVIPTYDRADLVGRSIESVLGQERPPDEILVVDDGSRDDTAAVVGRYGPAVTYLKKPHGGVAAARNFGVARTDAGFVAFLDSDDYWHEDHLRRVEAAIEQTRGEAWLYFSDLYLPRADGTTRSNWQMCEFDVSAGWQFRQDGADWVLCSRQPMMTPATVVRRDAYIAVGGQAENLVCREDTHLFFKLALGGPVAAVAGVAGTATADDPGRLSERYKGRDPTYWQCTRWLYRDLLGRFANLSSEQRFVLRRRLADAHWVLCRMSLQRRRPEAFAHVARAARWDRRGAAERLRAWWA